MGPAAKATGVVDLTGKLCVVHGRGGGGGEEGRATLLQIEEPGVIEIPS